MNNVALTVRQRFSLRVAVPASCDAGCRPEQPERDDNAAGTADRPSRRPALDSDGDVIRSFRGPLAAQVRPVKAGHAHTSVAQLSCAGMTRVTSVRSPLPPLGSACRAFFDWCDRLSGVPAGGGTRRRWASGEDRHELELPPVSRAVRRHRCFPWPVNEAPLSRCPQSCRGPVRRRNRTEEIA
jgi:hypothetical protein